MSTAIAAEEVLTAKLFVKQISQGVEKHFEAYLKKSNSTAHEQRYSIMERYGIVTRQQYYNLIHQTNLHIDNGGHYSKVRQLLEELSNEQEFRSGAYYAAGIFELCGYRFPLLVDNRAEELLPVIKRAIKFSIVEGISDTKKCLFSLGLLVIQYETIPFLLQLINDIGYQYHFSSKSYKYYTNYRPCIKKCIDLLEMEIEAAVDAMEKNEKEYVQWEIRKTCEELDGYTELMLAFTQ